ncbi:hypothetical protein ACPCUV_07040 [Streptomyces platensis]|uniref:hypothetical protein n=1 Tax=Streptomyces platensis TaxID=58346 RepID=UPI003C2AE075
MQGLACTTLNERPVAVTASADRTVRVWDLASGQPIGEPLTGHTVIVRAVACTTLNNRPVALTGSIGAVDEDQQVLGTGAHGPVP